MKRSHARFIGIAAVGILCVAHAPRCGAEDSYRLVNEIAVGGDGGWDLLTIDEGARRLYVTHASKIVVVDLDKERVVGEITNTPGVHGIAIAPDLKRGFTSNGEESKASLVDLTTLNTLSKVDTGEKPDVVVYEPAHQAVYVFNGKGNSVTVFDANAGTVVTTILLPGTPEFAVADVAAGRVYCNIEDKNEVVSIDTQTHQIVNTWPIAPGENATGMSTDAAHHRLFIGCRNKYMVMLDNVSGQVIATAPIGERVDATAFDPATQLAFSSNGEGTVTIAHEDAEDNLTVIQTLATERGARTMALDPKTHRIYLASAQFEPVPEPAPGAPRPWPKVVPGTLKILVYGMDGAPQP